MYNDIVFIIICHIFISLPCHRSRQIHVGLYIMQNCNLLHDHKLVMCLSLYKVAYLPLYNLPLYKVAYLPLYKVTGTYLWAGLGPTYKHEDSRHSTNFHAWYKGRTYWQHTTRGPNSAIGNLPLFSLIKLPAIMSCFAANSRQPTWDWLCWFSTLSVQTASAQYKTMQ